MTFFRSIIFFSVRIHIRAVENIVLLDVNIFLIVTIHNWEVENLVQLDSPLRRGGWNSDALLDLTARLQLRIFSQLRKVSENRPHLRHVIMTLQFAGTFLMKREQKF